MKKLFTIGMVTLIGTIGMTNANAQMATNSEKMNSSAMDSKAKDTNTSQEMSNPKEKAMHGTMSNKAVTYDMSKMNKKPSDKAVDTNSTAATPATNAMSK